MKVIDTRLKDGQPIGSRIWKSDLTIKYEVSCSGCVLLYGMDAYELEKRKLVQECWEQYKQWRQHPTRLQIRTLAPHHKNYTSSTNQTRRTLLISDVLLWTPAWMCRVGRPARTYISSCVRTRDVTLKTYRRRWMIGRNGGRRSGISAQAARHDDDDDDDIKLWKDKT